MNEYAIFELLLRCNFTIEQLEGIRDSVYAPHEYKIVAQELIDILRRGI